MTPTRFLACAVPSALLFAAAPALAQDGGGAAAATAPETVPAAVSQTVPDPPEAAPAQDETPTTPGGEEQPAPEPEPDGEQPPTSEPGAPELPQDGAGAEGETGSDGALPQTGWQAFALASIGLGLLLAGAALRPTSSWPPPRDRLSRSTQRR